METAKARVNADQSEANVMDVQCGPYGTPPSAARVVVRPELAPSLKADESQLSEEELNIRMVHAHWKVFRELARQQVRSTRFLKDALD